MLGITHDDTIEPVADLRTGAAPSVQPPLPGPKAKAVIERDERYSSPSYTRDFPLVVERALGSVVQDVDGNRFLDMSAGIAVCATGHCHPKVVEAIEAQARSLIHMCGADFYYPPMADLMEKLASIAPGKQAKRVFLTNSGAESVEAAIKLVRNRTGRKWLIAFHGAFHGRTMGALSLTCSKARHKEGFGPFVPMVAHVPYGDVEAIESVLFKHTVEPTEVAAVFVEAMQGEGGYVVPPPDFLPRLRALCNKHGILLVCDEIQSGMGRTGKWWAFEHFGVEPDVILTAKGIASGMPLGAVIASADLMTWKPAAHASTFGGNPVCCAAALATIDLIESTYMANAVQRGQQLLSGLQGIAERQKIVDNPRGLGLMCAIDIVNARSGKIDPKLRNRAASAVFERGVILLPCGESSIRFCPPVCVNEARLDAALKVFDETITTLA